MKYSFHYLLFQNRNYGKHDIYIQIFALTFTTVPTWFFLNYTKLSANAITLTGWIFGTLGALLGYFINIQFVLYGFIVFLVCDFVDGNVARAKGGGSYLGAILDMLSDRFVLIASSISLTLFHLDNGDQMEGLFLIVYVLIFLFMDIIKLAFYMAIEHKGVINIKKGGRKTVNNDIRVILSNPRIWVPTRLGSYIFVIVTYLVSHSFMIAYIIGIGAVVVCLIDDIVITIVNSNLVKSHFAKPPESTT